MLVTRKFNQKHFFFVVTFSEADELPEFVLYDLFKKTDGSWKNANKSMKRVQEWVSHL